MVPVREYLRTSYESDFEYLDGRLVERNVGEWQHSLVQGNAFHHLRGRYRHLKVVAGLRVRISGTRYRLPDISVVLRAPETDYLTDAAYLVIEILSKRDEMSDVMQKLNEYHAKGIANIWLIDPRRKSFFAYRRPSLEEVVDADRLTTADGQVWLTRDEIFAE